MADQLTNSVVRVSQIGSKPVEPIGTRPSSRSGSNAIDADGLTFSRHLNERITRRSIQLDGDKMTRLSSAVERAAGKGSRDSVVLLDDLAVLVNVSNRTVLTAIETGKMRDGVFTNIDSVVVG